jgi:hypothetical protein
MTYFLWCRVFRPYSSKSFLFPLWTPEDIVRGAAQDIVVARACHNLQVILLVSESGYVLFDSTDPPWVSLIMIQRADLTVPERSIILIPEGKTGFHDMTEFVVVAGRNRTGG